MFVIAAALFLECYERPGGDGARVNSGTYPRRFSRCQGAGESRRTPPDNDRRSGGAVPQNAGERRNPAAGSRCDRCRRENNLQVPPGDLKTKISLLFLICYVWLNQFIQL